MMHISLRTHKSASSPKRVVRSAKTAPCGKRVELLSLRSRNSGARCPASPQISRQKSGADFDFGCAFCDIDAQLIAIKTGRPWVEFTLDGQITDANRGFEKIVGYSLSELKTKKYGEFFDLFERESEDYRSLWRILRRGRYHVSGYRWTHKGGYDIWVQANFYPVRGADGAPYKVIQFATDITAQKLATADVESQIAAINRSQCVAEYSLDGTILNANDNFLKVFGYRLEEIKGRHHHLFVDQEDRTSVGYRLFREKLARGDYEVGEYKRLDKDGREIWLHASYNPILDMKGKPVKVVEYATNITARKRDELQLKLAVKEAVAAAEAEDLTGRIPIEGKTGEIEKLCAGVNRLLNKVDEQTSNLVAQKEMAEQATRAKSEFLSNMSHELRTPMHAILGYAEICTTTVKEGGGRVIERYLNNITISGKRLLALLNDLLSLAKMEADRIDYKIDRADLKDVVAHTLMELDPLIKAKNLDVQVRTTEHTEALFDKAHLIQVLINLVSNAIKFSNAGSRIGIELTEDRLQNGEQGVRCRVVDEGPGIPVDELTAVFDKFVQSRKTKSGKGGTGLGLAICDHIIKAHGGAIWAENANPHGAVFTFVIPKVHNVEGHAIAAALAGRT